MRRQKKRQIRGVWTFLALLLFVGAVSFLSGAARADLGPSGSGNAKPYKPFLTQSQTSFDLKAGVRRDHLDWNIASDVTGKETPNVLSELTWDDVKLMEIEGRIRHFEPTDSKIFRGGVLLEGRMTGGVTLSGDNQDSDYDGDNRTQEFSRSNNDVGDGHAFGFAAAVGYRFNIAQRYRPTSHSFLTVTPLLGYGWDTQTYKMTNGVQTIPALGAFDGLNSRYTTRWYGPFAGAEVNLEHNNHTLTLRGECQKLTYSADADWNLRDDFMHDPSYKHEADGNGTKLGVAYSYALSKNYDVTLDYNYLKRGAKNGTDTVYFSDGSTGQTRLNEVNNDSQALRLGMTYRYGGK